MITEDFTEKTLEDMILEIQKICEDQGKRISIKPTRVSYENLLSPYNLPTRTTL